MDSFLLTMSLNLSFDCSVFPPCSLHLKIIKMEADILKTLKFEIGSLTVTPFLRRFTGICSENRKTLNLQLEFLSNYLAELSLLDYECKQFLSYVWLPQL